MSSGHINLSLSPEDYEKCEEVCSLLHISKSKLFKIIVDYIYQKEIAKKKWPLEGFMEKYHIPADALGKITNTHFNDFDHAVLSNYYGGQNNG